MFIQTLDNPRIKVSKHFIYNWIKKCDIGIKVDILIDGTQQSSEKAFFITKGQCQLNTCVSLRIFSFPELQYQKFNQNFSNGGNDNVYNVFLSSGI